MILLVEFLAGVSRNLEESWQFSGVKSSRSNSEKYSTVQCIIHSNDVTRMRTLNEEKANFILRLQIKFVFSMCENTRSLSGKRINYHQAQTIVISKLLSHYCEIRRKHYHLIESLNKSQRSYKKLSQCNHYYPCRLWDLLKMSTLVKLFPGNIFVVPRMTRQFETLELSAICSRTRKVSSHHVMLDCQLTLTHAATSICAELLFGWGSKL